MIEPILVPRTPSRPSPRGHAQPLGTSRIELSDRFDDHGPRFLEVPRGLEPNSVAIVGVSYDGTTSFRPGTRFGPDSIRTASQGIETYSPTQDRDYAGQAVCDVGNVIVPVCSPVVMVDAVTHAIRELVAVGARPLLLGGEHSVSTGAVTVVAEQHPDLLIVQLDAHADLRDEYLGESHSHACTMRRCLDVTGGPLLQVGIRSGTQAEFDEMRAMNRLVRPEPAALAQALRAHGERPVYLTIDLDVFDPAVLPGTGTPEPGGITWRTFEALLGVLPKHAVVAADVVELSPLQDSGGRSSVLAAKVVREVLLRMLEGRDA